MTTDDEFDEFDRPSRGARKREAQAAKDLGEALLALSEADLKALDLPERLLEAIRHCRDLRKEALRRQRQYIGKLMRQVDTAPIQAAIEAREAARRAQARQFHRMEQWRDRLVTEGETALATFCDEYPRVNRKRLTALATDARSQRPGASRALFRLVSETMQTVDAPPHDGQ
ncbi:ribosome biogenesis factor YjgA [Ectothiorhodospira lacustris]|uniref:ribosome biogenesis factor YjgA n=1 Tax=Ectothiorhodospira lacustris TaxID=2899127 RepID=UPI001EE91BF2|nr:ribosome biogenesis factor YjgA [Ectothiorhodospira lacustris]MCG5500638.1 DUF615 domain-containing protein [Ectothiorhodospira lacustris]MCG5508947.1 DUF615 domain-containing protein [Ectothiorhodospira lacustris]MCG5520738.1 DUF615 domain-containing protein [Ectothiorhodospira lacustris]